MDALLSTVGEPLLITVLVVVEVAVWQLRVALAARGRKQAAAALGAVNAVISVVALSRVVTNLDRWQNVAGYAVGVALGVYLGIVLDELTQTPAGKRPAGVESCRPSRSRRPDRRLVPALRAAPMDVARG